MHIPVRFCGMPHHSQRLAYLRLRVVLARIDHVINRSSLAEGRVRLLALHGRNPAHVRRVFVKLRVPKVLAQQPELPQVIRDVLADVGDRSV